MMTNQSVDCRREGFFAEEITATVTSSPASTVWCPALSSKVETSSDWREPAASQSIMEAGIFLTRTLSWSMTRPEFYLWPTRVLTPTDHNSSFSPARLLTLVVAGLTVAKIKCHFVRRRETCCLREGDQRTGRCAESGGDWQPAGGHHHWLWTD